MAYSDFSLEYLKAQFNLSFIEEVNLFEQVPDWEVSSTFLDLMADHIPLALAIDTEKARSEFIIAPILAECRRILKNRISLFSGIEFNIEPEQGLNVFCDFIISLSSEQFYLNAPVIVLVEAKNDRIKNGIPQCIAEMLAAHLFNDRQGNAVDTVYGIVSTGSLWRFLKLTQQQTFIDKTEYHFRELKKIVGIIISIVQLKLSM